MLESQSNLAVPDESDLLVERQGPVLILSLHNPKARNALSQTIYTKGMSVFREQIPADPSIRAIVLCGTGGIFCGGGNLQNLQKMQEQGTPLQQSRNIDRIHEWIDHIRACPLPVLAAVEGPAAGAGFSLALACDMMVVADNARFVMAYVKVGLSPDGGGSFALLRALPRNLAYEWMLTGEAIPASILHQYGLINRLVPPGEALPRAVEWAQQLSTGASNSQARIKHLVNHATNALQTEQLALERDSFVQCLFEANAREGVSAFLEKRTPTFNRQG